MAENVSEKAHLGNNVSIGENVTIEDYVKIGNNVVIYPNTIIGKYSEILDNTVLGRKPISAGNIQRKIKSDFPPLIIGENCVIGACVVLYTGTTIENNVLICDLSSVREDCLIEDLVVLGRSVTVQYDTIIRKRARIMDCCHLPGNLEIEEDVFFSAHVCGANENTLGRQGDDDIKRGGPHVKKRAYVGLNATLLPGITLGEDSIVAAGAVVTKDVPPRGLVMGCPAKLIRYVEPRIL